MTEAQKILELIETVDPEDSDKLDEIDARVACLVGGYNKPANATYTSHVESKFYNRIVHAKEWDTGLANFPQYTRSRDALKAIRPEGWEPLGCGDCVYGDAEIGRLSGGWSFAFYKPEPYAKSKKFVRSSFLATEELAELYAIIQAIEYERVNQ